MSLEGSLGERPTCRQFFNSRARRKIHVFVVLCLISSFNSQWKINSILLVRTTLLDLSCFGICVIGHAIAINTRIVFSRYAVMDL